MFLSRAATIALLLLASCTQDPDGDAGKRPDVYSPTWPQFSIDEGHDPRVVTINRSGAGASRRAEYSVFELIDEGRRLRRLHKHTLRNEYRPWVERSLGRGRFLVTLGEIPGEGLTENCLVIYDFVRQASVAWRLEEFLPEEIREARMDKGILEGMGWFCGQDRFDTKRLLYYPNLPGDCRLHGYPFLVVDLRSLSVQLASVPDDFAHEVRHAAQWEFAWRWSMGNAGGEPDWSVPSLLPTYLLAVVDPEMARMDLLSGLCLVEGEPSMVKNRQGEMVSGWQTCFKLDPATGDYVKCPVSEWIERRDDPEKR